MKVKCTAPDRLLKANILTVYYSRRDDEKITIQAQKGWCCGYQDRLEVRW